MAAAHKITLTYDEDAGTLRAVHRCAVKIGEHTVSHSESVELADQDKAADALQAIIDANADEMERRTSELAFQHVAAVTGTSKAKQVKLGGTLGPIGEAKG